VVKNATKVLGVEKKVEAKPLVAPAKEAPKAIGADKEAVA